MIQTTPRLNVATAARLLNVDPAGDARSLRAAFRASVKRVHPDRPGGDERRLREVIEAYNILKAAPAPTDGYDIEPIGRCPTLEISPLDALSGGLRRVRTADGRWIRTNLPAGLRAGMHMRIGGQVVMISIVRQGGLVVIGDHLCLTVKVDPAVLRNGGRVTVELPPRPASVSITRQDGLLGLVRLAGRGLPDRFDRPQGDLLLHLRPAAGAAALKIAPRNSFQQFSAARAA